MNINWWVDELGIS